MGHVGGGTLGIRRKGMLRALIRAAEHTPFRHADHPQSGELERAPDTLASGLAELEDGPRFARTFGGAMPHDALAGRRVLDVGCGYGGRTVYYARTCEALEVVGIEISEAMLARCRALAARTGVLNVEFALGTAESLPLPDDSFDAVISFDVLEHVADPGASLRETHRVLRPGGDAWFVFPTYLGARSSHLDYVTRLPALHRVFDPETLVEVTNELLAADPARYRTSLQPAPAVGSLGRLTLPTLNGLRWSDVHPLFANAGLEVVAAIRRPLVTAETPVAFARTAERLSSLAGRLTGWPELLIGGIAVHAVKPAEVQPSGSTAVPLSADTTG